MRGEEPLWRHVISHGPPNWSEAQDYSMQEVAPGQYEYIYRRCQCKEQLEETREERAQIPGR